MAPLITARLTLLPITLELVEAVLAEDVAKVARLVPAKLPYPWPGRGLIEQAFCASIQAIQNDPDHRLWGDRIAISREEEPRVIGSVIFHGDPGDKGIAEVGYGIEPGSQGKGYATEALVAQVGWALSHSHVHTVRAITPPWHKASAQVLRKAGFRESGFEEHESLGEVTVFECRRV